MTSAYFTLLLSYLPKVLIGGLLFLFWWPMRKEVYGKSIPLFIGIGAFSILIGNVINPTLIGNYLPMVKAGFAPESRLVEMQLFWTACEGLFSILLTALLLSDGVNIIPAEVRARMDILRPLEVVYRKIILVGIFLVLLRILPAAVLYYYLVVSKGGISLSSHLK